MAVEIDGHIYITGHEYAAEFGRDASGLRHAARHNRCGIGDDVKMIGAKTRLYRLDLVEAWRVIADGGKWPRNRPFGDVTRIAWRYDLDRAVVYRHLRNGYLRGTQDDTGNWHITATDAKAWARDYMGIPRPVNQGDPE
jgi:hypothetical protein